MLYPSILATQDPERLVVPLFFFNPNNQTWYGAFSLETDWLLDPQLVFVPLASLAELVTVPPDKWNWREFDAMTITLNQYLEEFGNAS